MSNCYNVKSDISKSGESLKGDIPESGMSDIPKSGESILKEHLKEKTEKKELTFAQKHFASPKNQLLKESESKVGV